ncbi:magnesium/cobalt transporter CorA [Catalinimonas niigatensis]|uniref:magnesium/cobalt transporter CorA n=1 Tax=Catalinimonas niigatensis TaxID=1397264 RepID=UPI0026661739|nr:magnesium/cobalt transporter CorA [Catalinimonas niigatensis]WPP48094.1 magnesium/cobalt transporter CorA [Catalinimonas niigatensis]
MKSPLEKSVQQTSIGVRKMTRAVKRMSLDALSLTKRKQNTYKLSENAGTAPGTLIYTGINTEESIEITLYQYDEENIKKQQSADLQEILGQLDREKHNWVNISALHNTEVIQKVGDHFGLHLLVMEDIINTVLSPQFESYEDHIFITLKMLKVNPETHMIEQEHVSFILGDYYLISFQETKHDVFEPVRQRLAGHKGRIRKRKIDYLLYALIDVIVDNYYTITEEINDHMNALEDELIHEPRQDVVERIIHQKRQIIELRKIIYPLREALRKLNNEEELIQGNTMRFFDDVYSHVDHVIGTMESQREVLIGFMDLYMSTISNRMNNVMKTLTIIATIFIPLTFVAGVYGMNFDNMPELHYKWGYPIAMGIMFVSGIGMYIYMRSRKWF